MREQLTEQQKKSIVEHINVELNVLRNVTLKYADECERDDIEMSIKVQEIALASLETETVHQFIVNDPDKDGYIEWADCNPDFYSKEPSDRRRILYTAPPVPVLRFPKEAIESDSPDWYRADNATSWANGFNAAIAEVQRLNAGEQVVKPVKLPEPDVYEVNGTRFYDRLKESEVIEAIRAAGGEVAE